MSFDMLPILEIDHLSKRYVLPHDSFRRHNFREGLARRLEALLPGPRSGLGSEETQEHFWALKDVSFDVAEGDVVGIIGRNGAGKSTLLKIISRITDPTEGYVRLRARMASL